MRDARLRFGHLGYFALAAVLLADAFPARAKDATCSLGRFTVQGRALFAGVPDPAGADVAGAASVIVLAGGQVAITYEVEN